MKHTSGQRILLLAAAVLFAACSPYSREVGVEVNLPDGLKDCTFYQVKPTTTGAELNIVRCPLSTTSANYAVGKTQQNTVTVDQGGVSDKTLDQEWDEAKRLQIKEIEAEVKRLHEWRRSLEGKP
jgi:hypothetical protein